MTYYNPVYKDTFITSSADTLNYTVNIDNSTIFSGKAYRMPNREQVRVNINKICQDYLFQDLDEILAGASAMTNTFACRTFTVNGNDYTFLYCYDHDFLWTGQTATLSNPVQDMYAPGALVLNTVVSGGVVTTTASEPIHTGNCVEYCLYYVNARGGWDTLAILGTSIRTDNITQYTMDKAFDNNTKEFEYERYISEIRTKYVLNTNLLNDEQSENLAKNLIGSNKVYLHCLTDGTIKPVVITDTSVTYQAYQTNGMKLSQYKIGIQESQSKIRR